MLESQGAPMGFGAGLGPPWAVGASLFVVQGEDARFQAERVVVEWSATVTAAPPDDLDALLARLAAGDRAVFSQVFRLLWPPTLRFTTSLLGHEADAADAAQQAMQKIFERASDYDASRPAMPWALAIAAWECRTIRKKRARRREAPLSEGAERISEDPAEAHAERQLAAAAMKTLEGLSAVDQETLLATFFDAESSVSGATLRKRRERAIDRLRTAFRRIYGLD